MPGHALLSTPLTSSRTSQRASRCTTCDLLWKLTNSLHSSPSTLWFYNGKFDVNDQSGKTSDVLFDEKLIRSLPSQQADWDGFSTYLFPALMFVEVVCQVLLLSLYVSPSVIVSGDNSACYNTES
ncbi:hypothetical protein I7I48_07878 [Histoplasma ohiense]|nr:hypothetical protein I7I48_07878 [Histoplasma ohiense (nom. inval.)]